MTHTVHDAWCASAVVSMCNGSCSESVLQGKTTNFYFPWEKYWSSAHFKKKLWDQKLNLVFLQFQGHLESTSKYSWHKTADELF